MHEQSYQPPTTLFLVSCSQKKKELEGRFLPAKELYHGDLFRKTREYIEALILAGPSNAAPIGRRVCWGILSAKYGILLPSDLVSTYDMQLDKKRASSNEYGAQLLGSFTLLLSRLNIETASFDVVLFLGRNYRKALSTFVWPLYPDIKSIKIPFATFGIGTQKQKLLQMIREIRGAQ